MSRNIACQSSNSQNDNVNDGSPFATSTITCSQLGEGQCKVCDMGWIRKEGRTKAMAVGISIYLSIYGMYIALLQGNYSEALPAQARAKIKVLRSLQNELDKCRGRERIYR